MFGGMAFTALHFDIQHQPDIADPISMEGVAWSSWLPRDIADLSTCLIAKQLDTGISIKHPGGMQGFTSTLAERRIHPARTLNQLSQADSALRLIATFG